MIDKRATVIILVLATAAACGGWWLQYRMQTPPIPTPVAQASVHVDPKNQQAPIDLVLPDLDGKTRQLSQWRGKKVLLNFWATWCGPCREEMPRLSEAQMRYAGAAQIIGVALDEPQAVRDFLKRTPVDYPILIGIDADPTPTETFGDTAGLLPYSVLIGPDGRVLKTQLGPISASELSGWLGTNK